MGIGGVPRRYYRFDSFDTFAGWSDLNKFITIAAIFVFFAQVMYVINFFVSIWRGKKVTERNPWRANTLEWTTDIVPVHGNWAGNIPTVERWPYDYGKDGKEFIPQYIPLEPGEKDSH